jgi:hypothetical protein
MISIPFIWLIRKLIGNSRKLLIKRLNKGYNGLINFSFEAYMSKVENDIKDVRISTLQKIIEIGLGGRLNLSITL